MMNQHVQNFFYKDNFFSDLYELCKYNDWDKEEIDTFSDDFTIDVYETNLEPIFQLSSKWITECIDESRFSYDNYDKETSTICNILNSHIDFDKINSLIPKLYYIKRKKTTISKSELLSCME